MKSLPRALFIIFVIVIIAFSAYSIYNNEHKNENVEVEKTGEIKPQIVNELRLGVAEFDTMNPILSTNRNVQEISRLAYEPLVTLNSDYKAEPCLAVEWSKMPNNTYLIKLREDVKWHDGTDFTSRDVKFTIDKIKSDEIYSIYEYNIMHVIGLDIIDGYTLTITLDADIPFFEYNLTFPILSEGYFSGEDFASTNKNRNPVGTGRFKVYAEDDGALTFSKFKDYWNIEENNDGYGIETVHVYKYNTMGEVYNGFKIGNIDFITVNNPNVEEYIGSLGYGRKEYYGREFDFLALNTENNVLSREEVRKAISFSIDKGLIVSNVFQNKYYQADFPLDNNYWIYKPENTSSGFNPAQVTTILTENGWQLSYGVWQKRENNSTLQIRLTMVVNNSNAKRVAVAENIKEQLSKVNIPVTIRAVNDEQYQNFLNNKNYDMILTGTRTGFSPNLSTYLGAGNFSKYQNEEMTRLLSEVNNITDDKELIEKYKRIYEVYKSTVPFISLYFNQNIICYTPNLYGDIVPNNYNVFYNIEKWYRQY